LKLKEISYIHAEGYAGGELKHGPFALLTTATPVVGLLADDDVREKMLSNLIEVRARGAPVLLVSSDRSGDGAEVADAIIQVPECEALLAPFPHTAALHLLAYEVAAARGCSIDRPRNLAKSVTVE
jgi:glutamine---fructose-6-phosphate transaminase (isomerizing)